MPKVISKKNWSALLVLLGATMAAGTPVAAQQQQRPNIVNLG